MGNGLLKRFLAGCKGNVAMTTALVAIPLIGATGAAVDYGRISDVRTQLQRAVDAAALAAAHSLTFASGTPKAAANAAASANMQETDWFTWNVADPVINKPLIEVTGTATVPMTLMGVLGINDVTVTASAEAHLPEGDLEIALVLDNTGSMASSSKIGTLRTATTNLVSTLFATRNNPPENTLKIALVPFVTTVNVKTPGQYKDTWMDWHAQAINNGKNFDTLSGGKRVNHFDLFKSMQDKSHSTIAWKGCVEARPEPYDVEITPPAPNFSKDSTNPNNWKTTNNTLFVPYFWPDEADKKNRPFPDTDYVNNYLPDAVSGDDETRQSSIAKYSSGVKPNFNDTPSSSTSTNSGFSTLGPNRSCPDPITMLTSTRSTIDNAVKAMRPWNDSGTNIAQGMFWGWNVLDPSEPFVGAAPFGDGRTQKAMIVLTDGVNDLVAEPALNVTHYSSYGYVANNRMGTSTSRSAAISYVNTRVAKICENIKAQGIRLYTITFLLSDKTAQQLFRDCASQGDDGSKLYYNSPTTSELNGIFQDIAKDLSKMRLTR